MPAPLAYPTYGFDGDSSNVGFPVVSLEEIDDIDDEEVHENLEKDPEWQLSGDEDLVFNDSNESSEEELDSELEPSETDQKFILFNSCLDQLLTRCLKCGHVVSSQKKKTVGSMLSVELRCHEGHVTHWDSQATIRRKPVGNLLFPATILFTGNTFAGFSRLTLCLNLQFFSESVFYDFQRQFFFPVLIQAWEIEQQITLQELLEKKAVNLNGNGRCDNPGHNAKYSTYTLMGVDTGKVVGFSVVQVSETTSSNATDKEGFQTLPPVA